MRRLSALLFLWCVLLPACGGGGGDGGNGGGEPTPPPATTLYVRPSGNDDDSGTSPATAFRNVTRAAQFFAPNVTVYVAPGRYLGRVEATGIETTAAAPLRIIADPTGERTGDDPGEVVLDADREGSAVRVSNTPFVTVDGFVITGAAGDNATGIFVRATSSDATIRNCVINNGGPADGIRVQDSNDPLIFNNLLFDNGRGIVINGAQRARIINNTAVDNRNFGISIGGANADGVASVDATVVNNVIQDSRNNVSITVDDGPPSSRVGYAGNFNLAFAPAFDDQTKTYRPTVIRGDDDVNEDALFVDLENGDFRLDVDSPARDAGTGSIDSDLLSALFDRTTSADNVPDGAPPDMGYHYPLPVGE
jgi:parallel beta-helix repeat protein